MSKKTGDYPIPFSREDGNLLSYTSLGPAWPELCPKVEWKENYVFEDTLVYVGYSGGRSAMTMNMRSVTDGRLYPMFFLYFDWLIRQPGIRPGPALPGRWTFCKRGQNYSIKPVE